MDESRPFSSPVVYEPLETRPVVPYERSAAWLFLALGYLCCCVFPMSKKPLSAAFFLTVLYLLSFLVLMHGRARLGAVQKLVLFSSALALISALLWDNSGDAFLCFLYVLIAYAYLLYSAAGNCLEEGLSRLVGNDLLRAVAVFPFSSFGRLFPALASRDEKGAGKFLLKVLLGLLLAVLPTAAVLSLLSFDSGFQSILERIFTFRKETLVIQIYRLLFAVPVAMYLFGLYVSSVSCAETRDTAVEKARSRTEKRRFLPLVTAAAAVIPLLLVYIIFFVSQWEYYTSALTGVLPSSFSYSRYARDGFFELCAVSCINFSVLICLERYVRRDKDSFLHVLILVLSLFSLVLIATAAAKMILYVSRYCLTPDRLYASWFMLLLTVLFVIVILSQFFKRIKSLPLCLAATVVLYLLLALSGPYAQIARYNVGRYLSDQAETVDVDLLISLGDDAVPELLRLDEYWNQKGNPPEAYSQKVLQNALDSRAAWKNGLGKFTFSSWRAERLLAEAGYTKQEP